MEVYIVFTVEEVYEMREEFMTGLNIRSVHKTLEDAKNSIIEIFRQANRYREPEFKIDIDNLKFTEGGFNLACSYLENCWYIKEGNCHLVIVKKKLIYNNENGISLL